MPAEPPHLIDIEVEEDGWLDALVLSGTRLKYGARTEETYASGAAPSVIIVMISLLST